ncbi:MAG: dihydrofolate reductase [Flavobacteriaceae bacterium]
MITIIAAIGMRNELGKDNDLIWHLPADLKRFKKITTGNYIIMGRNTFESIGKPLPNRTSVIITRNMTYRQPGCLVVHSIEEALEVSKNQHEVFIIGGAEIYRQCIEKGLADKLDITQVHQEFEADVYFPEIKEESWELISKEDFKADEKNKHDYSFLSYKKKTI